MLKGNWQDLIFTFIIHKKRNLCKSGAITSPTGYFELVLKLGEVNRNLKALACNNIPIRILSLGPKTFWVGPEP